MSSEIAPQIQAANVESSPQILAANLESPPPPLQAANVECSPQILAANVEGTSCPICYDPIQDPAFSIEKCGHQFCRGCLEAFIESMVLDQNRFDELLCPQCKTKLDLETIEELTSPEVLQKYKQFVDNQRVAKDRDHLMFCIKPGCEAIIDLQKKSEKLVECPDCLTQICRVCRLAYHGEKECEVRKVGLFNPQEKHNVGAMKLTYCPKCYIPIEREEGCLKMQCYVCKHQYCWTCGYPGNNWFHRLQVFGEGTGGICQLMNMIQTFFKQSESRRCLKPIIYLFLALFLIIWPPLSILIFFFVASFSFLIAPAWLVVSGRIPIFKCIKKLPLGILVQKVLMSGIMFLLYPLALVTIAIIAVLFLALYYPLLLIVVPRQCMLKKQRKQIDLHFMIERMEEEHGKRSRRYKAAKNDDEEGEQVEAYQKKSAVQVSSLLRAPYDEVTKEPLNDLDQSQGVEVVMAAQGQGKSEEAVELDKVGDPEDKAENA